MSYHNNIIITYNILYPYLGCIKLLIYLIKYHHEIKVKKEKKINNENTFNFWICATEPQSLFIDLYIYSHAADNGPSEKWTTSLQWTSSVLRIEISIVVVLNQPLRSRCFSVYCLAILLTSVVQLPIVSKDLGESLVGSNLINFRDRDNLRTKDNRPVPKVSFVRRFDCIHLIS